MSKSEKREHVLLRLAVILTTVLTGGCFTVSAFKLWVCVWRDFLFLDTMQQNLLFFRKDGLIAGAAVLVAFALVAFSLAGDHLFLICRTVICVRRRPRQPRLIKPIQSDDHGSAQVGRWWKRFSSKLKMTMAPVFTRDDQPFQI